MGSKIFLDKKGHSGNTHIMIGAVAMAVFLFFNSKNGWLTFNPIDYVFIALIVVYFSRAPDIDQEGSKINDYFNLALVGVIIYSFIKGYTTYGIIAALYIGVLQLVNHRTFFHSVLGGVIVSAPLWFINPIYFGLALFMFIVHIISEGEFSLGFENDWW